MRRDGLDMLNVMLTGSCFMKMEINRTAGNEMFWLSQKMNRLGTTGDSKSGMQPAKLTHFVNIDSNSNGCFNMLLLASLLLHFWDPCIFCRQTNSLEFTS